MDILNILGTIGIVIGAVSTGFYKNLRNTISNLKTENDSLKSLLDTKDKEIENILNEMEKIKNDISIDKRVNDYKFEELNGKLETLKKKNELLYEETMYHDKLLRTYKEIVIDIKDHCEDKDCEMCKRISKILEY